MPFYEVRDNPARGYAGQIFEPGAPKYAVSRRASGAISAGAPVKRAADPRQVAAFEAGDSPELFAGVALLETSRPVGGIADGSGLAVLRLGSVLMPFAGATTEGHAVALDLATGELYSVAADTEDSSLPTGRVILPGLVISETIAAAGLAGVEVNVFGNQPRAVVGSA